MKSITRIITILWIGSHLAIQARSKEDIERFGWPMFKRVDVVTLHDKQIPKEYKRNIITDNKGRVLEGDWLEIDRKQKIVKFRRNDGKLFDVAFAELCENDRRYAELETGYTWNIGEEPPVPHNLIIPYPKDRLDFPPVCIEINSYHVYNDRIIAAEMVGEDIVRVTVKFDMPKKGSPETTAATDLPVKYLTASDREMIKKATNFDVPVIPRPAWSAEDSSFWVSRQTKEMADPKIGRLPIRYQFSEPMPTFKPDHVNGPRKIPIFRTAFAGMTEQFSLEEIFDHIRVKTLTSAFIYEYSDYCIERDFSIQMEHYKKFKNNSSNPIPEPKKTTKSLKEIMPMLRAEPQNETVSLKGRIDKFGLKLFEETAPSTPPQRQNDTREFGEPADGLTQAYHFVSQYIGMSKGKAKVPYIDFLKETTPLGYAAVNGNPIWYSYDAGFGPRSAVEKVHRANAWQQAPVPDNIMLGQKITRQLLRENKPVVVSLIKDGYDNVPADAKEGYAIIIGFSLKDGKPNYEAIVLNGPGNSGSKLRPPFKVSYNPNLGPEYVVWSLTTYIE